MKANDPDISEESQRKLTLDVLRQTAQRELAAGVLKQTAQDLRRFRSATSKIERKLYLDAYGWVMSDDDSWPFSFPNVCRLLHRAPEELRQELLDDLSFGHLPQWASRCRGAVRQFLNSVTWGFASEHNSSPAAPAHLVETWPRI
jgi:hypothetical protein